MNNLSLKPLTLVITEAIIVGLFLIGFVKIVKEYILPHTPNLSGQKENIELFFIAGFIFHLVFEYTGVNLWYSREYCKLL
jgi:hypothetical protein